MQGKQEINGASRFHTGDINLAAAIMSCGVPLSPDNPVVMIESETVGRLYGSFHLCGMSSDGMEKTSDLMDAWGGKRKLPAGHAFTAISEFVKSKPREIRTTSDLLDYAIDYLQERGIRPQINCILDIPDLVAKFPNSLESYVLAYVYNRDTCFNIYRRARVEVHQFAGTGLDTRHSLIDNKLPAWQRNELLS